MDARRGAALRDGDGSVIFDGYRNAWTTMIQDLMKDERWWTLRDLCAALGPIIPAMDATRAFHRACPAMRVEPEEAILRGREVIVRRVFTSRRAGMFERRAVGHKDPNPAWRAARARCVGCGQEYLVLAGVSRNYCRVACKPSRTVLVPIPCLTCGVAFQPRERKNRACSTSCAATARNQRAAAKRRAMKEATP